MFPAAPVEQVFEFDCSRPSTGNGGARWNRCQMPQLGADQSRPDRFARWVWSLWSG